MVKQLPHSTYARDGNDLVTRMRLPLHKALSGGTVDVPSLDGRILRVPLKEVVTPG